MLKRKYIINEEPAISGGRGKNLPLKHGHLLAFVRQVSNVLMVGAFALALYGLGWNYSTHRYLEGFADAIVPLNGSPLEKSEALLNWLSHEPERSDLAVNGTASLRDPVRIVQNAGLLKVCGSATNAFVNLADVAGLRTRRLLLIDQSGGTKHVVAEVQAGDRWFVVDPRARFVFRDRSGRALTKEDLSDPDVFRDAISRMPGYDPSYTFERTAHIHLERIPLLGNLLRRALDSLFPKWEEAINWGYLPEHPSLWPILVSLPLLLSCIFTRRLVNRYSRNRLRGQISPLSERSVTDSRALV